jgi:hypothetical protein
MITKAINARNHGARVVIVVNGQLGNEEEDLLTRFGSVSGPENVGNGKNWTLSVIVHSGYDRSYFAQLVHSRTNI